MAKEKKQGGTSSKAAAKKGEFLFEGKRIDDLKNVEKAPTPRLYTYYKDQVVPALMKKFEFSSVMQVPYLEKITLNMGIGDAITDPKLLQNAINELELISGQRPLVRKAKKAISNFKLRVGMPIGCMVTLRRANMYEFLDRFINIASPRIRDFRGFSDKSFDGRGNYSIGIKEQIIFPELDVDKVGRITGLDITFVVRRANDEKAQALLDEFGFPFRKRG